MNIATPADMGLHLWADAAYRQHEVNTAMTGTPNWHTEVMDSYRAKRLAAGLVPVDHATAALDEAFELFRSVVKFKWWGKNPTPTPSKDDWTNAVVELVDILHFWFSVQIADAEFVEGVGMFGRAHSPSQITDIIRKAGEDLGLLINQSYVIEEPNSKHADYAHVKTCAERIILTITRNGLSRDLGPHFARMLHYAGCTPDTLINLYFVKATLNEFRTRKFAEGSYNKVWATGYEDNHHLMGFAVNYAQQHGSFPSTEACSAYLEAAWADPSKA